MAEKASLKGYSTIKNGAACELVIQRSRFIGEAFITENEKDAVARIEDARKRFPDANHHCYAYVAGTGTVFKRFNDDGEPSGTAGMPILNVIEQKGLSNVTVIVTRYFGGVKLGAGGLVRAYSAACAEVIGRAGVVHMLPSHTGTFRFDYTHLGAVEHGFKSDPDTRVAAIAYDDRVTATIVTRASFEKVCARVRDICSGSVEISEPSASFLAWD